MPRNAPRGGLRNGTPGQSYANRTDLANQPSLPARVATGQTYGKAQQQLQAQRTVPMAPPPTLIPSPGAAAPQPGGAPAPGASPGPPPPGPGDAGDLHRLTERPSEPVTAGSPLGAGPGPEAIPQGPTSPQNTNLSRMLAQIAQSSGSAAVAQLAQQAQAAGQ